jgi:hypothetical protein
MRDAGSGQGRNQRVCAGLGTESNAGRFFHNFSASYKLSRRRRRFRKLYLPDRPAFLGRLPRKP